MKNLLAFLSVWLALPLAAQTVNPNQIRPATVDGQVLTTPIANQAPSWQTPASGVSVATTPPCTVNGGTGPVSSGTATITCVNGIQMKYTPGGSGQHVLVFATSWSCSGGNDNTCTYSGFALPSYVVQANVTAVYAIAISASTDIGGSELEEWHVTGGGSTWTGGQFNLVPGGAATGVWAPGQATVPASPPPTNYSGISFASEFCCHGDTVSVGMAALDIYYTGTAPPAYNPLLIQSPLNYNPQTNTLSLYSPFDAGYDFGAVNASQVIVPLLVNGPALGDQMTLIPGYTSTSTTPTVAVTNAALSGAYPIVNQDGSALAVGALVANVPILMQFDGTHWRIVGSASGSAAITDLTGDVNATGPGSAVATVVKVNNGTIPTSQTCVGTNSSGQFIDGGCTPADGVQYNPSTTIYAFASFSGLYDDNGALSTAVPAGAWSCNGTTCTVNTTGAHNLVAGDYVDVSHLTGWFAVPVGESGAQTPGHGSFPIISTGLTSTAFEFTYSRNTGSGTGGNVYNADYWGIYQTANQPFIKGHGTVCGTEVDMADLDTYFSTLFSQCPSGTPKYLIIEGGQNDIAAGASAATIEGHLQSVWAQAHTAGYIVIQGTIVAADYGGSPPAGSTFVSAQINQWLSAQAKSFSNTASGEYWDRFVDYASYLNDRTTMTLGVDANAAFNFAQRTNDIFSTQQSSATGPFPFWETIADGSGNAFNMFGPSGGISWVFVGAGDSSGGSWMQWIPDQEIDIVQEDTSRSTLSLITPSGGPFYPFFVGTSKSGGHGLVEGFNDTGTCATTYGAFLTYPTTSGQEVIKVFCDGHLQFTQLAGSGTVPLQVDPSGNVSRGSASGGGLNGTVTYTSSQTAASGDNGKLVIMNCSSACAYTLPATQPSTTWQIALQSVGSTTATLGLSGDTYNGGATAPVLPNYYTLGVWANTATSTDYRGGTPPVSGTNVTISPAANGQTFASSGSGGTAPSATFSIATGAAASPAAPYVLAPASGTVSDCYWTTLTSDGSTNLVFNVKFNGTNILSGTNATVTAGDTPGSSHTFSLTSGTITITQGQKWELDITTGATDWTGAVQCY